MHKLKRKPRVISASYALIFATAIAGVGLTTTSNSLDPFSSQEVMIAESSNTTLIDRTSFTTDSLSKAEIAQDSAVKEKAKIAAADKIASDKAAKLTAEKAKIAATESKNKAISEAKALALSDQEAAKKADADAKVKAEAAAEKKKNEEARLTAAASGVAPLYVGGGSKDQWLKASGIPESEWVYVDFIVSRESSWNPNATNASSGACGLAQALPCSKIGGAGGYDPVTALKWQKNYVQERYHGYAGAYAFWSANHWY